VAYALGGDRPRASRHAAHPHTQHDRGQDSQDKELSAVKVRDIYSSQPRRTGKVQAVSTFVAKMIYSVLASKRSKYSVISTSHLDSA
jgi:hypothetical protein